jgi:hypothetical protein
MTMYDPFKDPLMILAMLGLAMLLILAQVWVT